MFVSFVSALFRNSWRAYTCPGYLCACVCVCVCVPACQTVSLYVCSLVCMCVFMCLVCVYLPASGCLSPRVLL